MNRDRQHQQHQQRLELTVDQAKGGHPVRRARRALRSPKDHVQDLDHLRRDELLKAEIKQAAVEPLAALLIGLRAGSSLSRRCGRDTRSVRSVVSHRRGLSRESKQRDSVKVLGMCGCLFSLSAGMRSCAGNQETAFEGGAHAYSVAVGDVSVCGGGLLIQRGGRRRPSRRWSSQQDTAAPADTNVVADTAAEVDTATGQTPPRRSTQPQRLTLARRSPPASPPARGRRLRQHRQRQ